MARQVLTRVRRVWRCLQGKLINEELEPFTRAMGSHRSDWPPYTLYFAFEAVTAARATVDLLTWYDMGISENSRGGFAQKLELEKRGGAWVILSRDVYMYWD